MKSLTILRVLISVVLFVFFISIAACSSMNLLPFQRDDRINVKCLPDRQVNIFQPVVYREKDHMVVAGTVNGRGFRTRLHGHVDVAVFDRKGNVKEIQEIEIYRKFPLNKNYRYGYKAIIPAPIPDEEIALRIAYHRPSKQSGPFDFAKHRAFENE